MSNISTDRHNLAGAKLFKDIEVPPRKLLIHNTNKKKQPHHHHHQEMIDGGEEMNNLYKFLPFNNTDDVDSDDPAESDRFRMYEFKIRRCTRSRSHDWTDCPFAHPGEKARRRDPRRYNYSGAVCSEYRRGGVCSRGDDCEFAHGVFECWLHPSRYRTEACKDGKNCKRKVCFFAHSLGQLRSFPNKNHCCCIHNHANFSSSPTSTLLGNINIMHQLSSSPSLSPPLSPSKQGYSSSPLSRLSKLISAGNSELSIMSYKDALNEMIISSLDAMSFNEVPFSSSSSPPPPPHWIDVNSTKNVVEDQQQFVLSPSTPSPSDQLMNNPFGHQKIASTSDPDLGWVNDLLK